MTSAEMHSPLEELISILAEAETASQETLIRFNNLVHRADAANRKAANDLAELEQFLEQFALESGLVGASRSNRTFHGEFVDLEAMRQDVVTISVNAAKAAILSSSLASVRDSVENAARHFGSDDALTASLDAMAEHFQTAINEAREDERRKLAREIHDGPAQVLANAIYAVQIVEQLVKRNPAAVDEEIGRVRDLLKEGVTEVRRFMFDLRPATLQDYGLAQTVQKYVDDYGRFFGRRATCTVTSTLPALTPEQDLTVFRIIQEALQNVHKHAGNDAAVEVTMTADTSILTVRIADDGAGFDPALVSPKLSSGAGLLGMRERASIARARLTVESRLGGGSVVTLSLPIDAQSDLGQLRS
jgi:two-component system, NarL family, sensor histidine kinase DegS